jgi:hypothetical protein
VQHALPTLLGSPSEPTGSRRGEGDHDAVGRAVTGRLTQFPVDLYWDIFEPLTAEPDEAVGKSVADDLQDIYLDVAGGLMLYERGLWSDACWQWKFTFGIHWGEHLVGLQRALYWIAREHPPDVVGA